jgi:hypothetical protein
MRDATWGVFTPTGGIFCVDCHNATHERQFGSFAREATDSDAVCDRCNGPIYLDRADVALCQRIARELRESGIDAHVWQTGGMCVAVGISFKGEVEHEILITDSENPRDCGACGERLKVLIGCYRLDADGCPDPDAETVEVIADGAIIRSAVRSMMREVAR